MIRLITVVFLIFTAYLQPIDYSCDLFIITKCLIQGYDGFGGRSKPDVFPERPFTLKKPVGSINRMKKTGLQSKVEKNQRTVDKFFGSFDTP